MVLLRYRSRPWTLTLMPAGLVVLLGCVFLSTRFHALEWLGLAPRSEHAEHDLTPRAIDDAAVTDHADKAAHVVSPEPPQAAQPPTSPPFFASKPGNAELIPETYAAEPMSSRPEAASAAQSGGGVAEIRIRSPIRPDAPIERVDRSGAAGEASARGEAESDANLAGPAKTEQALREIGEQARQAHEERAQLEGVKSDLLEQEQIDGRLREIERRRAFHQRLGQVLTQGNDAALAEFRELLPLRFVDQGLSRGKDMPGLAASRDTRRQWIVRRRAEGADEATILGDLTLALSLNRVQRSGPHTLDQALVQAARELLSVPPDLAAPEPGAVRQAPNASPVQAPASRLVFPRSRRR
jgi:hypothetical protein